MTPQQKAKELVNKFYRIIPLDKMTLDFDLAKKCALIAVDELLEATKRYDYTLGPNPSYNDYWLKVKYQIENL
jgi:hypothetical protein